MKKEQRRNLGEKNCPGNITHCFNYFNYFYDE